MSDLENELIGFVIVSIVVITLAFLTQKLQNKSWVATPAWFEHACSGGNPVFFQFLNILFDSESPIYNKSKFFLILILL